MRDSEKQRAKKNLGKPEKPPELGVADINQDNVDTVTKGTTASKKGSLWNFKNSIINNKNYNRQQRMEPPERSITN